METKITSRSSRLNFLGSFALIGLFGYGVFQLLKFYRNYSKNKLSPFLENYIKEVQSKISSEEKQTGRVSNIETFAIIFNLVTEIEEFLYMKEYSHVEESRLKLFKENSSKNSTDYEGAVMQTIEFHENTMNRAYKIIFSRLGFSIASFQDALKNHPEKSKFKEFLAKTKKFEEVEINPLFSKEKVREAYIYYSKAIIQQDRIDQNNIKLSQKRPELTELCMHIYFLNKYIIKDTVKLNYGIEERDFERLLKHHKLVEEDEEVRDLYTQLRNF